MARKQHVNRENKLAIIIGFSLVLVVAVLISDHFSRASSAEISAEIKAGVPEDFGASPVGLTEPIGGMSIPANAGPLAQPEPITRTVSNPDPVSLVMGGGSDGVEVDEPPVSSLPEEPAIEDPVKTPSSVPAKPVSDGSERAHEVKNGDTLYRLAEKYYKDGTLWKPLAEYNRERVPSSGVLRTGVTLRIPPKDVLLGEAVLAPAGSAPTKKPVREGTGGRPVTPEKKPAAPAERSIAKDAKSPLKTYKVVRGDSLGTIAQKLLGSSRRASELYQLNKDLLEDEHSVVAGMVIKVPAR